MDFSSWAAVAGVLLIVMALGDSVLARLPLSTAMLYLLAGAAASPLWLGWAALSPAMHRGVLEHVAEVVVLLSLFTSGLKMSLGLGDGRWLLPLRLALTSMLLTVAIVAVIGVQGLGLSLGAAVLLGGILAPTDPVLASDVQVANADDRDRLRFALTGEAGLNDGTAYPVVLLGLALLGMDAGTLPAAGWGRFAFGVAWGAAGGLLVGAALGTVVGQLVLYLRRVHREATGLDNFLALGLIGLAYGVAILVHGYGFLAVFAAGVALRRLEQRATQAGPGDADTQRGTASKQAAAVAHADPDTTHAEQVATHPQHAPAFMAHAVLAFNEQIERVGEMVAVVAMGALLWALPWRSLPLWFVAAMLLLVRPVAVAVGLAGSRSTRPQRRLMAWFGIRGIGSLYYLMFAMNHGLDAALATRLATLTLGVVVASIVVHGISVTPLMTLYEKAKPRARGRA